jgi:hypothetical protein
MATREQAVAQAKAWHGKKESDGSYKEIVDVYNSAATAKAKYSTPWCAEYISAIGIKIGADFPISTSCGEQIKMWKAMGCWVEDDAYVPTPGDVVYYDWDDNGKGDDTTGHDHTGMVIEVSGNTFKVEEGNKKDAVGTRTMSINGQYIRGYAVPKYDSAVEPAPAPAPTKSVDELAKEVIDGKWGNNPERKKALTEAGYDYDAVQKRVNEMLKGSKPADPEIKWIVDPTKVHSVLNVRATPNGKIVGHLGPGTKVEVVEEHGDWARIGTDRWVFKSYLKKT